MVCHAVDLIVHVESATKTGISIESFYLIQQIRSPKLVIGRTDSEISFERKRVTGANWPRDRVLILDAKREDLH